MCLDLGLPSGSWRCWYWWCAFAHNLKNILFSYFFPAGPSHLLQKLPLLVCLHSLYHDTEVIWWVVVAASSTGGCSSLCGKDSPQLAADWKSSVAATFVPSLRFSIYLWHLRFTLPWPSFIHGVDRLWMVRLGGWWWVCNVCEWRKAGQL